MTHVKICGCMRAEDALAARGVDGEVSDPGSRQPRDRETSVRSVRKTHRGRTGHEAVQFGGIGAEISAQIAAEAFDYLDAPPLRLGGPFTPVPYSPVLERAWIVGSDQIVETVQRLVRG